MKRWISMLLIPMLLLGAALPAAAEGESADARLRRVTEKVKDTLDLDTEAYDGFRGEVSEQELGNVWSLNWTGDGTYLSVDALEDGTVVRYWRSDEREEPVYSSRRGSLPTLSQADEAAAKAAAEGFLRRVLLPGVETAEVKDSRGAGLWDSGNRYYSGTVFLNGLPSPLSWSVTVRTSDNTVTSFYREAPALSYLDGIPSPDPAVSAADAAKSLREAQKLELIYVVSEDDPNLAVLRYVSRLDRDVYVDAQTGETVSPEQMNVYNRATGASMAADMGDAESASAKALTQAELAGIEKLEGVLNREELDKAVRAESAYQLDKLSLAECSYRLSEGTDGEPEQVLAYLRYSAPEEDADSYTRNFTVDARSGKVQSLDSYAPWDPEGKTESKVSLADAQAIADAFLGRFTEHAEEHALYDTADAANGDRCYSFTYARTINGYFFPAQNCSVRIDRVTGAVSGVSLRYDGKVKADSAEGLISADKALDAWMDAHAVTLAYRTTARTLDPAVDAEQRLLSQGMTAFRTLFLSYGLERETPCPGIDAKTGKPVERKPAEDGALAYTDLDDHWAKAEIETLASSGIGYDGGLFRPDQALTQWDLVCLLAATQGYRLDPETADADERTSAYQTAYRLGALTREQRDDGAPVDRMDLIRMLLDCGGYGDVAALEGIFTCDYPDAGEIPAGMLGYAALAQGIGLVKGSLSPALPATRAMAAAMLLRLLRR